jgi:hypothetical protein
MAENWITKKFREIASLPDSPKEQVLVGTTSQGGRFYLWMSPRERAIHELAPRLPVPYAIANLLSTGAPKGSPGETQMASVRTLLEAAGGLTGNLDVELLEAEAIARQRLGFTAAEFQGATTEKLSAHLRHHLGRTPHREVTQPQQVGRDSAKGGRPVAMLDVNGAKIKQLRGDWTRPMMARRGLSVDNLEKAENKNRATKKTLGQIVRALQPKHPQIKVDDLLKKPAAKTRNN